jgi:phosphoglycerate dehydrogenase-like enzyme
MIGLARRIAIATHQLKQGQWIRDGGVQLFGRTVGIIGLGHVGKQVARVLQAVGCPVIAHDIADLRAYCAEHAIRSCSFGELLREADVVTLHVPLTPATRGLIGRAELCAMRPGAFLINTARGGVVDEDALADALAGGTLAGAASDVFVEEPTRNARLLAQASFIATPHVGGNSREAVHAVGMAAIRNLVTELGDPG